MPNHIAPMLGRRFGKLIVVSMSQARINGLVAWNCKCDCGENLVIK